MSYISFLITADRVFWKLVPAVLKKPTLHEFYRRLRDLDYSQVDERMFVILSAQVDERMFVILSAIFQLDSQGKGRE